MNLENLTEAEVFVIKWQYNLLGSFRKALAEAIKVADIINLGRIRQGYPEEVEGFQCYTNIPGWWDKLKVKAGIEVGKPDSTTGRKVQVIQKMGNQGEGIYALLYMRVCAERGATDKEILAKCNKENPCGTSGGWARVIREDEKPWRAPVQCSDDSNCEHLIVIC